MISIDKKDTAKKPEIWYTKNNIYIDPLYNFEPAVWEIYDKWCPTLKINL